MGASPLADLLAVTLPLSMPGVAAGGLLVFVLALGFYITRPWWAPARDPLPCDRPQATAQLVLCATLSAVLLVTALAIIASAIACGRRQGLPKKHAMIGAPAGDGRRLICCSAFPSWWCGGVVLVGDLPTFPPPASACAGRGYSAARIG